MTLVPPGRFPAPGRAGTSTPSTRATRLGHDHAAGLEWEDLMPEINRQTNPTNMIWQLVDKETGARMPASPGPSALAIGSRSASPTRWTKTTRCTTPSTFTARDASWC